MAETASVAADDVSTTATSTGATVATAAPAGWQLPALTPEQEAQSSSVESVLQSFKATIGKHGGPSQYLRATLKSEDIMKELASWLFEMFPLRDDMHYSLTRESLVAATCLADKLGAGEAP